MLKFQSLAKDSEGRNINGTEVFLNRGDTTETKGNYMGPPVVGQRVLIRDCVSRSLIGASADVVEVVDAGEIGVLPVEAERDRRVRCFSAGDLPYFNETPAGRIVYGCEHCV